ncbi:hypothetical protein [Thermoanaerobacter sp. RKWS2]|uniref:hypothetical protein n=1 Tax=Thermoanaerobacter sp. RKWS2 TaxID=2983842 RepID=UPI00224A49DD|nr:hypothetical protein [Thermoanaerobacter sp. RKWS2]UZQ81784.1 hypothetical protein OEI98_001522 [Thermoanaerobacter sp. RKWS2]
MDVKKLFVTDCRGQIYEAKIFCEEKEKYYEIWKVLHESVQKNFPLKIETLTFIKDWSGWHLNILEEDDFGNIIREETIKLPGETSEGEYITFDKGEAEIKGRGVMAV